MLPAFVSQTSDRPGWGHARWLPLAVFVVAVVATAALHAPTLHSGLVADDHLQVAMLEGNYPVARAPWDLYAFSRGTEDMEPLMRRGVLPWWSHPDLRLSALRPLSSLTLWLDVVPLRLSPWARHLHSLFWLFGFVGVAHLLFQRLLEKRAALMATLILAVDPAHVWPAGWLANRTALISATLGLIALLLHLRHQEKRTTATAIAVPLVFGLALLSGEYALSIAGLALGCELLVRGKNWRARLRSLAPWFGPALLYFALHKLLGYGAYGSSVYVDPISSPLKYLLAIILRLPALLASELFLLPSELVHGALVLSFGPSLLIVVLLCALFFLLAALALRGQPDARRVSIALGVGLLASLLPLVATLPSSRLLVVPSVAGAGLLATVASSLLFAPRRQRLVRSGALAFGAALLLWHLPLAAMHTRIASAAWTEQHTRIAELVDSAELRADANSWVLLNAAQPTAIYLPWMRAQAQRPNYAVLTICPEPIRVRRVGARAIELVAGERGMLTDPASRLFRGLETPFPTTPVETGDVRVQVLERTEFGVKRIRVDFARALDDPALMLLALDGGRLKPISLPEVGREVTIEGLAPVRPRP